MNTNDYHEKTPVLTSRSFWLEVLRPVYNYHYIEKASKPPSTTHTVPVTALEASDAR